MDCEKKAFSTRHQAVEFANAQRKRNGRQRPYLCIDNPEHVRGGVWHLTSQPTTKVTWYRDHLKGKTS